MQLRVGNVAQMTRLVRPARWLSAATVLLLIGSVSPAIAVQSATPQPSPAPQKKPEPAKDEFPPNPLELTAPDPLLPGGLKRPLNEAERTTLAAELNKLNEQATAKYRANDPSGAFDLWNRELRLRRALGFLEEVRSLGRVGDFAWRRNVPNQVQVITKRLEAIQAQVQAPLKNPVGLPERSQVLPALGIAYQQVRSPGLALSVYNQMLTEARKRQSSADEVSLLNTIAQLHLSWFDYPQAIATYTELLNLSKTRNDAQNLVANLIQLVYVHEEAKQPGEAVKYQQQLVEVYQKSQPELVPALRIRLADNYAASGQPAAAEQQYQQAFQQAQPLLQLAYASDALRKLGALYRNHDRLDAAVQVYEYLAGVQEQEAYDVYGVMDAHDQLGQIHLARKAYPEALAAFQRGLLAAQQINYRADYFNAQIQKVAQQTPR